MGVRILIGDVFDRLRQMPDESVHCVVTSPPYWGLRDYGVSGQIGLEPTLGEHLDVMVRVFREVRRVLRSDGTLWLNYGDCYATQPNGRSAAACKAAGGDDRTFRDKPFSTVGGACKPKDLCMVPHRLAIALQEDGWWVRSDIVWHKPNPMPSSVKDRPTPSKEYLFLLTKSARYFYDADAIREPLAESSVERLAQDIEHQTGSTRANGGAKTNGPMKAVYRKSGNKHRVPGVERVPGASHVGRGFPWEGDASGRNKRDVWTIPTEGFAEAHFATMPTALVEPCILAGTSERGVCPHCGAPWVRIVDDRPEGVSWHAHDDDSRTGNRKPSGEEAWRQYRAAKTLGWYPSCDCADVADLAISPVVLDPFGGAGTTGLVADRMGRDAVLIELNPEYAEIARRRIAGDAGMFAHVETEAAE